jgi:Cu-Zn family superoxide dismutase
VEVFVKFMLYSFTHNSIQKKITTTLIVTALCLGFSGTAFSADSTIVKMKNVKGEEVGEAKLTQTQGGVLIQATLTKLPPGEHGFHIHEVGKCEPPFESAGGHFNPGKKHHGYLDPQGQHAGDLPNIHVSENGMLKIEILAPQIDLQTGENALRDKDGAAILIHAKPDDYQSQPSGDAGDRIACGVIGPPKP